MTKKKREYSNMTGGKKVLSFPGLTGESVREMSGTSPNMTGGKKVLSFPCLTGESLDCRIKSGNDRGGESLTGESVREMSGTSPNMTIIYLSLSASFLSYSGLTRISRDPRNTLRLSEDDKKEKKVPEHDRKKNKSDNNNYLFVIPVLDTGIYKRYSGQARI